MLPPLFFISSSPALWKRSHGPFSTTFSFLTTFGFFNPYMWLVPSWCLHWLLCRSFSQWELGGFVFWPIICLQASSFWAATWNSDLWPTFKKNLDPSLLILIFTYFFLVPRSVLSNLLIECAFLLTSLSSVKAYILRHVKRLPTCSSY